MFTHLHVHTENSLLDGHCKIEALVKKAKALGQTALAITDHGYMYGVIDFYNACKAEGIKPIIGLETYTAARTIYDHGPEDRKSGHLVLLAKNDVGYHNLIKMASIAATEGKYYKPRVDRDILRKYHEGVIALSGCVSGDIPRRILADDYDGAVAIAQEYKEIFGDDFFLELQYHGLDDQKKVLSGLIKLARAENIPLVATNDVHYIEQTDAPAQRLLMCMSMKKSIHDETALGYGLPAHWYLKSEDEMASIFTALAPEALANTTIIADRCNVEIEMGHYRLPKFPIPAGWASTEAYFTNLCCEGLGTRYGEASAEHAAQLDYEMKVIKQMGFIDYFLIVGDFMAFAKDSHIPVGPGRGSAAGSMVAYCLGITDIEPTKYGLFFERFLNPERISMPDIDIDFDVPEGREAVMTYVTEKYGADRVVQIITFGTMAAKGALRDAGKALEIDSAVIAKVGKMIPNKAGVTIAEALRANQTLKKEYDTNPDARTLIDAARSVEGLKRHSSTHAAGLIIAPDRVDDFIPIQSGEKRMVSQFSMGAVEQTGMLKVDFLGLKTLSILAAAQNEINATKAEGEPLLDLNTLTLDDPEVYQMLSAGKTAGLFQFESDGMRDVLRSLQPTCFEDLIAAISLYRPGPMESIPRFCDCKHHPEKVVYKHPLLEPILKDTYGCIVYQEQVMAIVRSLAGYSLGRADMMRRVISKKKFDKMALEKEHFINGIVNADGTIECDGCLKRGVPLETAETLWREMEDFAAYAFNKAHAASYAVLAYRTAYLKYFFPLQFEAAMLTSVCDDTNKMLVYINDCEQNSIKILPPDVNVSKVGFSVEGQSLRFGLLPIKNIGKAPLEEIVSERTHGAFTGLQNIVERCPLSSTKDCMEGLIKAGAFDAFPQTREQMIAVLPKMLKAASKARKEVMSDQIGMEDGFFTGLDDTPAAFHFAQVQYEDVPPLPMKERLKMEQQATGIYISGHPMNEYKAAVASRITHQIFTLAQTESVDEENPIPSVPDGAQVRIAGIITTMRAISTKKGSQMCFMTIEDQTGMIDVTVFPRQYEAYGSNLAAGVPILLYGTIENNADFGRKVIADSVEFLDTTAESRPESPTT